MYIILLSLHKRKNAFLLKSKITLRTQEINSPTRKQIKREIDEKNKDAIIASLHRRIKKLEGENKELRERLKTAYAEVYKKK